jgi:hypothetical protein
VKVRSEGLVELLAHGVRGLLLWAYSRCHFTALRILATELNPKRTSEEQQRDTSQAGDFFNVKDHAKAHTFDVSHASGPIFSLWDPFWHRSRADFEFLGLKGLLLLRGGSSGVLLADVPVSV